MGIRRFQLRRLALTVTAALVLLAMSVGSAWAGPPATGSIEGSRTLSNGVDPDPFNTGLVAYQLSAGGEMLPFSLGTVTYLNDGTYTAPGLTPGTYRIGLKADHLGPVGYPRAFYGGGDTPEAASDVTVTAGAATLGISIQRGAAETLTADAAEPDNRPKDAKPITASASWAERTLCELPDVDWYKFDAVAGHTYSIDTTRSLVYSVWGAEKTTLSDTAIELLDSSAANGLAFNTRRNGRFAGVQWTAPTSGSVYVRVTSAQEGLEGSPAYGAYRIRLADFGVVSGTGTLAGTVLDASHANAPVKGAYVTLTDSATDATYDAMTRADGTYSVAGLPPASYDVRIDSVGNDTTCTAAPVVVSAGATASQILYVNTPASPELGLVQGVVHLTGGGVAAETTATLIGPSTLPQECAITDSGTFYFDGLTPGLYTLTIRKAGYRTVCEQSIVVGDGDASWSGPTFIETLVPAGAVTGTVRDGSTPLAGVTVSVAGAGVTVTAANGAYAISEVETGSASVTFSKAGYAPLTKPADVSMGATSTLDASLVRLKTACSITRSPASASLTYKRKKGSAKFTLKATVKGPYWAFSGTQVVLQSSANGKNGWKTAATVKTSAAGVASKTLTVKKASTRYYRWYTANSATHSAAYSTKFKVRVK